MYIHSYIVLLCVSLLISWPDVRFGQRRTPKGNNWGGTSLLRVAGLLAHLQLGVSAEALGNCGGASCLPPDVTARGEMHQQRHSGRCSKQGYAVRLANGILAHRPAGCCGQVMMLAEVGLLVQARCTAAAQCKYNARYLIQAQVSSSVIHGLYVRHAQLFTLGPMGRGVFVKHGGSRNSSPAPGTICQDLE
ncbi:hypothetical protein BX600DRAFT_277079 [Xylariales sp. PMI_506]|nr:hypothetical protein BX600DRAFT_277079 [Xylariales sp. PMI_506]